MNAENQEWEPGVIRVGAIYVTQRVRQALAHLSAAQGRARDAIATEALTEWLESEFPEVLEFIKRQGKDERELEERLKAKWEEMRR